MSRRLIPFAAALLIFTADSGRGAQSSGGAAPARAGCQCPAMPVVATSAKPSPGHVHGELTLRDLEAYLSTRESQYDGDWDKALTALAHDIDPTGELKLTSAPVPPPVRKAAIEEGGVSFYLIHGPATPADIRAMSFDVKTHGGNSTQIMFRLVDTIARCNKYGEPAFGLRKALLRVARFLAGDLARVPFVIGRPPPPQSRAQRVQSYAMSMRRELWQPLANAAEFSRGNTAHAIEVQTKAAQSRGELTLDVYDRANAALDVLLSIDESGGTAGLFEYNGMDAPAQVRELLRDASLRGLFGGRGQADPEAEAVACKALTTIVAFADLSKNDGAKFRAQIFESVWYRNNLVQSADAWIPPRVVSSALILAGMSADDNPRAMAERLFAAADVAWRTCCGRGGGPDVRFAALAAMSRDLQAYPKGSGRQSFIQAFAASRKSFVESQSDQARQLSDVNRRFLEALGAAKSEWDPRISAQPCASEATPPDLLVFVQTKFGLVLVNKLYRGVPLVLGVPFDEPYDEDFYRVSVKAGGSRLDLVATPYQGDRKLYVTDAFELSE